MSTSAVLLGTAIGDSLGMPFEMKPADHPKLLAWTGGFGKSKYLNLSEGQYTDDTQMSKALAKSLIANGGLYKPQDAMGHYVAWYKGDPRGSGGTIRKALEAYQIDPSKPSGVEGSLGNGTVMRCAPLGVVYRKRLLGLRAAAQADAELTHLSPEAVQASIVIATVVARILRGEDKHTAVLRAVALSSGTFKESAQLASKDPWDKGISPGAIQTAVLALWCVVSSETYLETVEKAIRLGGDTDTNAAVAGAIAGALYGLEGIPEDLVSGVEDSAEIQQMDRELYDLGEVHA